MHSTMLCISKLQAFPTPGPMEGARIREVSLYYKGQSVSYLNPPFLINPKCRACESLNTLNVII